MLEEFLADFSHSLTRIHRLLCVFLNGFQAFAQDRFFLFRDFIRTRGCRCHTAILAVYISRFQHYRSRHVIQTRPARLARTSFSKITVKGARSPRHTDDMGVNAPSVSRSLRRFARLYTANV